MPIVSREESSTSLPARRAATAAVVAADLLKVGELAQGLSLVSKNARTLVAGAGDRARALGVIAEHFSELAETIIQLTKSISKLAMKLARLSVQGWRGENGCSQMERSRSMSQGRKFAETLDGPIELAQIAKERTRSQLRVLIKRMNVQLSELYDCMRTSEVISVTFLLEASQSGENETALVLMASKIDSISKSIRDKLTESKSFL